MEKDNVFRSFINGLDSMNRLNGEDEPIEEPSKDKQSTEVRIINDVEILKLKATIVRLRSDVYLIQPLDNEVPKYMVRGNEVMEDMGVMTVKEALKIINSRKKKSS